MADDSRHSHLFKERRHAPAHPRQHEAAQGEALARSHLREQLLGAVVVGWAVFGDLPDGFTWLGAAVIVASGLHIGWSQARSVRRA